MSLMLNEDELHNLEDHYGEIFYQCNDNLFIFDSKTLRNRDNCKLFLKYIANIIENYRDIHNNKQFYIIFNLNNNCKKLKLDFLVKVVNFFQKKYELYIYKMIYICNYPKSVHSIYNFLKPFMNKDISCYLKFVKSTDTELINKLYSLQKGSINDI